MSTEASPTEHWLPVVGYAGYYSVSDRGRVRSEARVIIRGGGKGPLPRREQILKPATHHTGGYQNVNLAKNGPRSTHQVHVLVLTAFVGPRPEGMEACHNNGDPCDNRLSNLRWDSPQGNAADRLLHGTNASANKTRCPRRHLLAAPNLVVFLAERGKRECLACNRARTTANNRKRRHGIETDWVPLAHEKYAELMAGVEVAA